MCLYVNSKVLIAKENLRCFKVLQKRNMNGYCTPFMCMPINFRYGMAKADIVGELRVYRSLMRPGHEIHQGIHAYCAKKYADKIWGFLLNSHEIKNAIIPKGAQFCIGQDGDVVATKMIIFRNDEAFEKFLEKNKAIRMTGIVRKEKFQ